MYRGWRNTTGFRRSFRFCIANWPKNMYLPFIFLKQHSAVQGTYKIGYNVIRNMVISCLVQMVNLFPVSKSRDICVRRYPRMKRRKDGGSVWMPMVLGKNKALSNITVFTEKFACIQYFMIMESVFHSDCYRDLILGRNSIFYKEIYRN